MLSEAIHSPMIVHFGLLVMLRLGSYEHYVLCQLVFSNYVSQLKDNCRLGSRGIVNDFISRTFLNGQYRYMCANHSEILYIQNIVIPPKNKI